ncbi:LexA family transcriptional repressor [Legionella quinlivanii]|uniref:LexA family transcriptional repressor n=1 Tax=Legionella quinlivanii TaxID=45073 RepID=A0A364LN85_9GAMM|nr:XRE family transcriptional regulator [Legionella quinlivanii]RAP38513.1 LexA family transcriptional repressor [Legionella quinlivanii]
MNIKEKIGQRIKQERISKGLTRKALSELTENLKISRINNYERGERTPGPEEIKQLAQALEVSAAFLMCLSDDKQGRAKKNSHFGALIPILDFQQACNAEVAIENIRQNHNSETQKFIPVAANSSEHLSGNAFALEINDDSMAPEFRVNDKVIIDPENFPKPGDFVAAKLDEDNAVIIRKYKQLSTSKTAPEFELIALNNNWANVQITDEVSAKIIGTIIYLNRIIKA